MPTNDTPTIVQETTSVAEDQNAVAKFLQTDPEEWLPKLQSFFQRSGKQIGAVLGGAALIIGGWYAYNEYLVKPKEEKAADAIYKAQQYFSQDSSRKVLDGDGVNKGVLYVISNYGGTKAANLAHYYAGISYLKLGEFNKAIDHLKDFGTDAKQIQLFAYGALGDAYAEAGKKDEALEYYAKAGTYFDKDEGNSAEYLFRAALLAETLGKEDKAYEYLKIIKEKYPKTEKGSQIDKYLYKFKIETPE